MPMTLPRGCSNELPDYALAKCPGRTPWTYGAEGEVPMGELWAVLPALPPLNLSDIEPPPFVGGMDGA